VEVWTARISTRDPDRIDVSRKSGEVAFAPSWKLLGAALDIRRSGREQTPEEWRAYARAYLTEMRASHLAHPGPWEALLARERAVLTCYCTDARRCHRTLLGRFLVLLGADFKGELPKPPQPDTKAERELFEIVMALDND